MPNVDVAVIGGGAAGLAAVWSARRRGASMALVERGRLGGDCTWTGCVPSKALIARAGELQGARRRGLDPKVDFGTIMGEVRAAIHAVAEEESREALEARGVAVLEGQAAFTGPRRIDVDGATVTARAVVIATGSTPLVPPIEGLREARPLTNETVFGLDALPASLAVIGGGPVGVELAQAFARLGSEVTLFEGADRLLGTEEPEASAAVEDVLAAEGVRCVTGSFVERVTGGDGGAVALHTDDGTEVEAGSLLCAVGRRPVTDGLRLDRAGVTTDERGSVLVDPTLRTTAQRTYAAGDVTGDLQFTHVGYDMGALAAGNALGRFAARWSTRAVPWATFTDPEVGRVGLTEAGAYDQYGSRARVAYLPLAETDRGRATGRTDGFVKLVAGPCRVLGGVGGGQLLGATIVAPSGGDLVHEAAFALRTRAFTGRLAQTVHAYPSWAMALRQAAAQFFRTQDGRRARPARPAATGTS